MAITDRITLGTLQLVGEHLAPYVCVTVDGGSDDNAIWATESQWLSLLALSDSQRARDLEVVRLRAALAESIGIANRRGSAIDYMRRQVDGYEVIKEVADEIEHGVVDVEGRARIEGATVLPNSATRLSVLRDFLEGRREGL